MKLETVLLGNRYKFSSIKEVLAKALSLIHISEPTRH